MDRLWSPWRAELLNPSETDNPPEEGSLFRRLAEENRDEENLILWRGEHVFVIMNLYPYNNGHLLILPYREVSRYEALSAAEQLELARTVERCIRWLRAALKPDGFNVGMNLGKAAGAGIPEHLHMHVVPRWDGDTNFMTSIGEVKVIPEDIVETYQNLLEVVESLPPLDEAS